MDVVVVVVVVCNVDTTTALPSICV